MSTRAVIARLEGDGWRGVYHHSDGYPSGLGCYIFRLIRQQYKGDVAAFLKWAIDDHDGGWSHIFPSYVLKRSPKGGETSDKSHPAPQCYCHGYFAQRDGKKPGNGEGIQSHDKHSFDIEWVYVLDPGAHTMAVLSHHPGNGCPDNNRIVNKPVPTRLRCFNLETVVGLDGPEPDWWQMESKHFTPEHLEKRETWVDAYLLPVG